MSTSLDRKIEAARLRAEAERKMAGGPATPDEVAAFESGQPPLVSVCAGEVETRGVASRRKALDAVRRRLINVAERTVDPVDEIKVAAAPPCEISDYLALMAVWAERRFPGVSSLAAPVVVQPGSITAADLNISARAEPEIAVESSQQAKLPG